jgi:hypothetical protein
VLCQQATEAQGANGVRLAVTMQLDCGKSLTVGRVEEFGAR